MYARLGFICLAMLAFSGLLVRFQIYAQSSQAAQWHPTAVVRFCVLVVSFLWFLCGMTVITLRKDNEHTRDIIGTAQASSHWARNAVATLATTLALVLIGVSSSALISGLHLHSRGTHFLVLTNSRQAVLFLLAAITAGFVEEFVFRGYLQRRFTTIFGSVWLGAAIQIGFFTGAHIYQGWTGMISVCLLGLTLTLTATACRTLVPGMIAHGVGDALGPILFLAHHLSRNGH
jgi:membrane protease YdiL (CAAX protease family)